MIPENRRILGQEVVGMDAFGDIRTNSDTKQVMIIRDGEYYANRGIKHINLTKEGMIAILTDTNGHTETIRDGTLGIGLGKKVGRGCEITLISKSWLGLGYRFESVTSDHGYRRGACVIIAEIDSPENVTGLRNYDCILDPVHRSISPELGKIITEKDVAEILKVTVNAVLEEEVTRLGYGLIMANLGYLQKKVAEKFNTSPLPAHLGIMALEVHLFFDRDGD